MLVATIRGPAALHQTCCGFSCAPLSRRRPRPARHRKHFIGSLVGRAVHADLFHLLVPGGKWQTLIGRPVWSASRCSSVFHRRVRLPLEPPQSAVIVSAGGVGVALAAEVLPPAADRGDGELGGVVVDPDADPALVVGEVVDPVGDRLAELLVEEVVTRTGIGGPSGATRARRS